MRKALFTVSIGDNEVYKICNARQKEYCDKHGYDFIVIDKMFPNKDNPKFALFYLYDLLSEYDVIVRTESDVYFRDIETDILDIYEYRDCCYGMNEVIEYKDVNLHYDKSIKMYMDKTKCPWLVSPNGHYQWWNFAPTIIPKKFKELFHLREGEYSIMDDLNKMPIQPYLNYKVQRYDIPFKSIDREWAVMMYFEDTLPELVKEGKWLHFGNMSDKLERLKRYV